MYTGDANDDASTLMFSRRLVLNANNARRLKVPSLRGAANMSSRVMQARGRLSNERDEERSRDDNDFDRLLVNRSNRRGRDVLHPSVLKGKCHHNVTPRRDSLLP